MARIQVSGWYRLGSAVLLRVVDGVVGPASPQQPHPAGGEAAECPVVALAALVSSLPEGGRGPCVSALRKLGQ